MNIFILDENPVIAASYYCDQHKSKMILETAQMLCAVVHNIAPRLHEEEKLYKVSHANHPCTLWLKQSYENVVWVLDLCNALDTFERKGSSPHKSMLIIDKCEEILGELMTYKERTPFVTAISHPDVNKNQSVVKQYQDYYRLKHIDWVLEGKQPMTYKGRKVPDFMKDIVE